MQVPIIKGIYTDNAADFRAALPVNMVPVVKETGISNGYLRPGDGVVELGTGPGVDRGGINWKGVCYRVMGSKLVKILADGSNIVLGDVGPETTRVSMDYSFERLAIAAGGRLYYWDGTTLQQVTDPDLGTVVDTIWVDGFHMTTDGEFIVVTELTDPFAVNPLKYGSSEVDPDPIVAIRKIRSEPYVVNRYTVEVFDNVGGDLFPFQRIDGAQLQKGAIGTHAVAVFNSALAFIGSGRNESLAVYMGLNGSTARISTDEVDQILEAYTEEQLATAVLEARVGKGTELLYAHLPDRTLVYDAEATKAAQEPVWYVLVSALAPGGFAQYRAQNLVRCYDKWIVGDPLSSKYGYLVDTVSTHWAAHVRWEFSTGILYNKGQGAVVHELEVVCLTGRVAAGADPQISTSYTNDGVAWSTERARRVGKLGERGVRVSWLQQGMFRHWRVQRFRGDSQAFISCARLEAKLEALNA